MKIPEKYIYDLRIVFYSFYRLSEDELFGQIPEDYMDHFMLYGHYTTKKLTRYYDALKWVAANPDADLGEIDTSLPHSDDKLRLFARNFQTEMEKYRWDRA